MTPASDLTLFLGRFHPLLVHLPIGLIVLLAFLELLGRSARFAGARAAIGPVLLLAVPTSIASVICGWLLASGGGYDEQLLQLHRWTGVAVAVLCTLLGLAHGLDLMRVYRLGLGLCFVVLVGASHFGGSLTHGKDYLARYAPGPLRTLLGGGAGSPETLPAPASLADQRAYEHVAKPLLDKYCVSCHGPEKAKGGLRLDSLQAALKGGDNGAGVVPGKLETSSVIQRVLLPADHDDHMPPEGKPQPGAGDLALLKWWVETGASDKPVGELKLPAEIQRVLEGRSKIAYSSVPAPALAAPKSLAEILPLAETLADELGISITALSPGEPWLQCNASLAGTNFGDADLAKLAPLAANLRWLDLAGTAVTDAGLTQIAGMRALVRLHLERTAVTDAGLASLWGLNELEYLNLHSTSVTDAGLTALKSLPRLRQIYLWQTQVTPDAAKAFEEARMDKEQIAKWRAEIQELQTRIESQNVKAHLGAPATTTAAVGAVPINTICPVSNKLADRTKTLWHEGKLVAFCCDDCRAAFEKDPKPHLARLAQLAKEPPGGLGVKPVNEKCPVSGEAVDASQTTVHEGRLIAFCCAKCKATFEGDPKPYLAKLNSSSGTPAAGTTP